MSRIAPLSFVIVVVLVLSDVQPNEAQFRNLFRQQPPVPVQPKGPRRTPPVNCGYDTLMIFQDCRVCICPKPNRPSKCFRRICETRTKDSGQCPPSIMRLDDTKLCTVKSPLTPPPCRSDNDCPGPQLCCFDFCHGSKCVNPVALLDGVPAGMKGRFNGRNVG